MENYRELFRLVVEHDYCGSDECRAFSCGLSRPGQELLRRRDFCFRQLAANAWALYGRRIPVVDDELTLSLRCLDPAFPLYTDWAGYVPSTAYTLDLPAGDRIEADADLVPLEGKRGLGMGLCTVRLRLGRELYAAAEAGTPLSATLHFKALAARWTYQFIPRREREFPTERLRLEDETGQVVFGDMADVPERPGAVCTVSRDEIPLRSSYGCKLRLVAYDASDRRTVLLANVAPPEPGRFLDAPRGTIQSICYY